MARQISRAEAWETAHEIFTQVNFNAFDFNTIKDSLLDYTKLYYPEDFNDYIESSEFVSILELFAYVGELLAYRLDLNAHENFITTAERKESILRIAKMLSYKVSRNIPARGLVKITSVQSTESVLDSNGADLAGRKINWNDLNNNDWKEQFLLVINRVLEQDFGTVTPNERVQVEDVLFELYTLNNNPLSAVNSSLIKYTATSDGETLPMELVPVVLDEYGPSERRPENNSKFSLLYANDGLGDGSDTTGFLMYTKQGTLQLKSETFDGVTPNQTYDIEINNINETDIWLNNVNPNTNDILINDPNATIFPHLVAEDLRYGEWIEVDVANAQNIIFNTNKNRHKYEVETLDNDRARLIFGDGEFSDIPNGTFQIWYRTSANQDIVIERNSVVEKTATIPYVDVTGSNQTLTITFSLINSLQNASASEDIEHIRRVAPSVYYTQDRMVNGRDYNIFMLKDPSILKLRSVNRTFAGDSKYIAWHDPKEYYEDVKLFGDDMALYWVEHEPSQGGLQTISTNLNADDMVKNYIEPLLSTTDFYAKLAPIVQQYGGDPEKLRRIFNGSNNPYSFGIDIATGESDELASIKTALNNAQSTNPIIDIYYSIKYDEWTIDNHTCDAETQLPPNTPSISGCVYGPAESFWMIRIVAKFEGSTLSGWDLQWRTRRMLAHSEYTKFWNTNDTTQVINYNSFQTQSDTISILKANPNANDDSTLDGNIDLSVIGQELVDYGLPDQGLVDINRLSVLPSDLNGDGIPDDLLQDDLFNGNYQGTWPTDPNVVCTGNIPIGIDTVGSPATSEYYLDLSQMGGRSINNASGNKGLDADIKVTVISAGSPVVNPSWTFDNGMLQPSTDQSDDLVLTKVMLPYPPSAGDVVQVELYDYVYFYRESTDDHWVPQDDSTFTRQAFMVETDDSTNNYKRYSGRYPLNFAWFHHTQRLHLVDPTATNIIDMFVITLGYYTSMVRYLSGSTTAIPDIPTPAQLRNDYQDLIDNKMISDTVVLHPGKFKLLFGSKAEPQLQCVFKVVRPSVTTMTDNQLKVNIVSIVRDFFDVNNWEFGETFFFTELSSSIHAELGPEIDSIVLVPKYTQNYFGNMFQIYAREDEMFLPDINTINIEVVQSYTLENIKQTS